MIVAAPGKYTPEWLNSLDEDGRRAVAKSKFALDMHNSGCQHPTWLFWSTRPRHRLATTFRHQGSVFFLDCGRGPFAVTANHVYEQFLKDWSSQKVLGCQLGNLPFDPRDRLIASGTQLGVDIATFRVARDEVDKIGKRVVIASDSAWPVPPNAGEVVFFAGFPAVERDLVRIGEF